MNRGHRIGGAFVFALVGALAALCLLCVFLGARVYGGGAEASRRGAELRNAIGYLVNRARSSDISGGIELLDGMLVCDADLGEAYAVFVYEHEGWLCEQLAPRDRPPDPALGERLFEIAAFSAAREGNMLFFSIVSPEGADLSASVALRCARAVN